MAGEGAPMWKPEADGPPPCPDCAGGMASVHVLTLGTLRAALERWGDDPLADGCAFYRCGDCGELFSFRARQREGVAA